MAPNSKNSLPASPISHLTIPPDCALGFTLLQNGYYSLTVFGKSHSIFYFVPTDYTLSLFDGNKQCKYR